MTDWLAKWWHAMRERVAQKRAEVTRERVEEIDRLSPRAETVRVLQSRLDGACDDVQREQAELAREREEVARERVENDRLRAAIEALRLDNRALLNSLLGTVGIPPLEVPRTGEVPSLRRPSWPQIAAKREIEAARKIESGRKAETERKRQPL